MAACRVLCVYFTGKQGFYNSLLWVEQGGSIIDGLRWWRLVIGGRLLRLAP